MRGLIVYYSLAGNTRKVAQRAAQALDAEVVEVHAPRYDSGAFRILRAAIDGWRGRLPPIEASGAHPEGYDFVLVMAPVWAGHAATPMRAYLARNRGRFKRVAFLLTCGGHCPPRAFEEMAAHAGLEPEATFTLRDQEINASTELPPAIAAFLSSIKVGNAAQV
jgi:flavodoxin